MTSARFLLVVSAMVTLWAVITAPAAAQFEMTLPETPPKEGQTLLEWAQPPILKHTIAEYQRGDTRTCAATSEYDLEATAFSCWPVLRAAQLFLLADYAAQEPTGDRLANQRQAIVHADRALAFIGRPEWPLQEYLATKSLEVKLNAQRKLGDWTGAYETSVQLVSSLQNDLFRFDEFRLGYAYRKQSEVLIMLDMVESARLILEDARQLLGGFDGEKVALPFSNQSEDMIVHAINAGDFDYAEETARLHLNHIRTAPRGLRFGYDQHIDLRLYLFARQGNHVAALKLLEERFADQRDYRPCTKGSFQFPKVLGPLVMDENIRTALIEGGCPASRLAPPDGTPIMGLGDKSLPAFATGAM